MLQIILQTNHLTERPDDYMAVVSNVVYKSEDDIIKQITGPGSILKPTECVAVISAYWGAITENLKEGTGFTSDYVNVTPAAGGVFYSEDESFDDKKHWKDVNLTAGSILRKSSVEMKVVTKRAVAAIPVVRSYFDIRTQSWNQNITPGFMADILGDLLKIEGTNAGVFFVNVSSGAQVAAERIHVNEPKKLTILIPQLPVGSYRLEVRSHIRGGKELRTGLLNAVLTVA
jgi:hypothetical protein